MTVKELLAGVNCRRVIPVTFIIFVEWVLVHCWPSQHSARVVQRMMMMIIESGVLVNNLTTRFSIN